MEIFSLEFLTALGMVVLLDIVLAGDNAVVIAMASRRLPERMRRRAVLIGTAGAVVVRMLLAVLAVWLMHVPYLQAIGGLILLPIALKLLLPAKAGKAVAAKPDLVGAVQTIIVADAVMGIDNVLAVAGAAQGNLLLVILGLAISVPIVIGGSQLIGAWMVRWPLLVYIGAGIMAWTAGSMVVHDAIVGARLQAALGGIASVMLPALAAVLVCSWGWLRRKNLRTGGGTGIMEE